MSDLDKPPTRLEQDTVDVLLYLQRRPGVELSYAEIAAGVGIADGNRLRTAVCNVRRVAFLAGGHRLEGFRRSPNPLRRGQHTTRYMMNGHGDELGAADALRACRRSVSALDDMHRACSFEADNPSSLHQGAFKSMAKVAAGAMEMVAGVEDIGTVAVATRQDNKRKDSRIADLEALVSTLGGDPTSATA